MGGVASLAILFLELQGHCLALEPLPQSPSSCQPPTSSICVQSLAHSSQTAFLPRPVLGSVTWQSPFWAEGAVHGPGVLCKRLARPDSGRHPAQKASPVAAQQS